MKYLEVFKEYNNEYYFIIDKDEWMRKTHLNYIYDLYNEEEFDMDVDVDQQYDYINNNWIPFTKGEVSKLEQICGYKPHINPNCKWVFPSAYVIIRNLVDKKVHGYTVSKMSDDISIVKLKDEWYYVMSEIKDQYYKCDQFEGAIQLIQNHTKSF